MRITYLHPNLMPSSAANTINVARMCAALGEAGHDVVLMCRRSAESGRLDFHRFYGVPANYRVLALSARALPDRLLYLLGLAFHRLRGGDLIYTRNILAAHLSTRMGMATVVELHHPPSLGQSSRRRLAAAAARPALRRVLANSPATLADAQAVCGDHAGKCVLAPHGVELTGDEPPPRDPSRPLRACYAGSFYVGRGVDLLIDVAERVPEMEFWLIGAEPAQKARVEALLRERGVSNATLFERVEPARVREMIRACDVCLAPYERQVFHRDEGGGTESAAFMAPLKIFDYMGSGRAIMASDLPAIASILEDGVSGCLCDPDSAESWASALRRLASDPSATAQLAHGARRLAQEKYCWGARVAAALA